MKPEVIPHSTLSTDGLNDMFNRLQTVKKAELLCGYQIPREEAVQLSGDQLVEIIHDVFVHLIPLYNV